MSRQRIGFVLAVFTAVGFVATAGLHFTGYDSVSALARQAPGDLGVLVPALWLAFSLDLTVIGLIVAVATGRAEANSRAILAVAALCPLGAAALQLRFIGFIPPTAVLLVLGGLALTAAAVGPARERQE